MRGQMLERLIQADANGDGKIQKAEAPERMAGMFDRLDANSDGELDKEELEAIAQRMRGGQRPPETPAEAASDETEPEEAAEKVAEVTTEEAATEEEADEAKPEAATEEAPDEAKPEAEVEEQVAEETGKTPAQVALNWCLSHPNVIVIPKTNSVERTVENCEASGWSLTSEQVATLDAAFPL